MSASAVSKHRKETRVFIENSLLQQLLGKRFNIVFVSVR
jgi:hypothetical protein